MRIDGLVEPFCCRDMVPTCHAEIISDHACDEKPCYCLTERGLILAKSLLAQHIMENALVIGASGGIGHAVASALATRGVNVTRVSRSENKLDVTNEASIEATLAPFMGPFDLVFVATGALEIAGAAPEKSIRQIASQAMADQFALNCIGPSLILKHSLRLLPKDRRARKTC